MNNEQRARLVAETIWERTDRFWNVFGLFLLLIITLGALWFEVIQFNFIWFVFIVINVAMFFAMKRMTVAYYIYFVRRSLDILDEKPEKSE